MTPQVCKKCGAIAESVGAFCVRCGEKLIFDSGDPAEAAGSSAASPTGEEIPPSFGLENVGSAIVVEVETNRIHVQDHASQLRFRVTNNLPSTCTVTLRMWLHGQGRFVEQDDQEVERSCEFERRGDQCLFSFPFRGLVPGEIPVRELQAVVERPDTPDAICFGIPDQSLFVAVADANSRANAPGIVVSGGINLDFSQLKEMYGADIKDILNVSARLESDRDHQETRWVPIRLRVLKDTAALELRQRGNEEAGHHLNDKQAANEHGRTSRRTLAVGIDLGTTFSVVAYLDHLGRPVTVSDLEGERLTPSVVLMEDYAVIVGREAFRAIGSESDDVAQCAKRDMGRRMFHKSLRGRQYPPEALSAWILNKLRIDSQQQIGPYSQVVITVPAYFDEVRRKATQDAGYIAGLDVIDIINEPTAAALAYWFQAGLLQPDGTTRETQHIMVYDLGGGTFDVTVMRIEDADFLVLATDGDVHLGGHDWDQRLVDLVADEFVLKFGMDPREDPNVEGRLWRECEEAKRTLSARKQATLRCTYNERSLRLDVTRQMFEKLTLDLLERTEFTARQTLQAARLVWSDIDRILLVGGASRMPAVSEALRDMSGKEPCRSISPDEAVAHGAALYAGSLLDRYHAKPPSLHITNVNSHSLGVVAVNPKRRENVNAIIIPRNTALPASIKRRFWTGKNNQRKVLVEILEGEGSSPEECSQVGELVQNLPVGLPRGTPVDVFFQYGENGRLTVRVAVEGKGELVKHEVHRENSLTVEQLNSWRKYVSGMPPAVCHSTEE
jgi:molecular chaperone DnaK